MPIESGPQLRRYLHRARSGDSPNYTQCQVKLGCGRWAFMVQELLELAPRAHPFAGRVTGEPPRPAVAAPLPNGGVDCIPVQRSSASTVHAAATKQKINRGETKATVRVPGTRRSNWR